MSDLEKANISQEEYNQSEAERVLGSGLSFEEFRKAEDLRLKIELEEQKDKPKYCYHGIGENVMKIGSILENGLVSKNNSAGIESYSANNAGYNGDDNVSVAVNIPTGGYNAYRAYIWNGGVSFIIEDDSYVFSRHTSSDSGFENEAFIYGGVEPTKIKGILINDRLAHKPLSELGMIGDGGDMFVVPTALNIIQQLTKENLRFEQLEECKLCIEQFDRISDDETLDFFDRRKKIEALKESINKHLGSMTNQYYSKILGEDNPELIDVVRYYNKENLPILTTSQVPVRQ